MLRPHHAVYCVKANNDHGDVVAGNGSQSSSGNVIEHNSYSRNTGWYRPDRMGVGCSKPGGGHVVRNINVHHYSAAVAAPRL